MLTYITPGSLATKAMGQAFKAPWNVLPADEKVSFEKKARDHVAKQDIMQECISDALRKEHGGNCSRSFQRSHP